LRWVPILPGMSVKGHNAARNMKGFTLIELVMVITITGVISISGVFIMLYLIQHSIYLPNKLNVEAVGDEIMDTLIEGYSGAKGLRFTTAVSVSGNSSLTFLNADGQTVIFSWDSINKKISVSINGGPAATIPYYLPSGMYVEQNGANPIFTYYDTSEVATVVPASVRRVKIEFQVRSGSGNFQDWQSQLLFASAVAVRRFQ
ncbi:MAG: prepilin-type N-terminal cleavage/methylation domain-containing protein, partial [bacterium]